MNTVKLKNIIIAILALLNLLLVTLLFTSRAQERSAYDRSLEQLAALYAANDIAFDPELLPRDVRLATPQPVRDTAAEQSFAAALLDSVVSVDSGGGIYRYYNAAGNGECLFRSSGAMEAQLQQNVDDPVAFCHALSNEYGYTEFTDVLSTSGGSILAMRTFDGAAVYNCSLSFLVENGMLTAVRGTFLPRIPLDDDRFSPDLITALTRFLDYRNSAGLICTEITGVDCGYLLQSTASIPLQLVPVAHLNTNVNNYYVNLLTYEVTRIDTADIMLLDAA